jgi:predicted TIM-barrel fold metal-dependent hydrolase
MTATIIDAHAHCGILDRTDAQSFEDYQYAASACGIQTVVMFSPVQEIYDRYDPDFEDTPQWQTRRAQSNAYLLGIGDGDLEVIPYFFIWNDFAVDQLTVAHKGIKWHRHFNEPTYDYDTPGCEQAIATIGRRNLPVVLEETFENTMRFIDQLAPDLRVIIPHLGMLNGGFEAFERADVWGRPNIWADTALASTGEMRTYLDRYGDERLLFGSDFPFGSPARELAKVRSLELAPDIEAKLLAGNLMNLLAAVRQP